MRRCTRRRRSGTSRKGITIELTNGGGADNVMAAVLSGSADIGFCGPEAALYVLIGGSDDVPTVFGQLTKRDGSFLVSRVDEKDTFDWATSLEGKEILAGRPGGVPAMTFEYVLNNNDLYDGTNVTMNYDVNFNYMTAAFESGIADYCTMFEPVASDYEAAGKGAWQEDMTMTEDAFERLLDIIDNAGELEKRVPLTDLADLERSAAVYAALHAA